MTVEQVAKNLMQASWIFAKTMAYVPHYYTLRKRWEVDADFVEAVMCIQEQGIDELYYDRPFRVLLINEFKYWSMEGRNVNITNLINRKPHGLPLAGNKDIHWVVFNEILP